MMTARLRIASAVLGLATAVALTGCSAATPAPSGSADGEAAGSITVYNAQHEELTQEWADAFTAETGIEVILRHGNDSELGNQIVQEGAASPADVFLTENSPAISLVDNADMFAEVDASTLEQLPEEYRPSSGHWTGIAARATVLVYNEDLISEDELPTSMLDLADPAWKGKWAASPSGADFQAIIAALLELEGEDATREWLAGMKENVTAYKGNSTVLKAVNAGEVPVGLIYHYYWIGDQAGTGENSDNTKQFYFKNQDPGAFVSESGGGVLKTAKNPDAAQAFLAFITSEAGQDILRTGTSFEYPVGAGVEAHEDLVPLEELDAPEIDPSALDSTKVTELMIEAGLL